MIATESAVNFFTKEGSGMTSVTMKKNPVDSSDAAKYLKYSDREDFFGKKRIPGSAMNATIDNTHPLGFGMKSSLYSLKFGTTALQLSKDWHTVGYYSKDPGAMMVAGYASRENLNHLAGQTFAGMVSMGRGKIVFLTDNTQYRMFWLGPTRLMENAVMQLPGY